MASDAPTYRLAVLADLHGNLPAFEAVLADLREHPPIDGMLIAGDLVGGPFQNEMIEYLQSSKAWIVRGNAEDYATRIDDGTAPPAWTTSRQYAMARRVCEDVTPANRDYLRRLPLRLSILLPGALPITVFHGSPDNVNQHLDPSYSPGALERAFEDTDEKVLIFGHSHMAFSARSGDRLAINPGAVCAPLNGQPGTQYATLTWDGDAWTHTFHCAPYDLELFARAMRDGGWLDTGPLAQAFIASLRDGHDWGKDFVDYAFRRAAQAGFGDLGYVPDEIWDAAGAEFWADQDK